MPSSCHSERWYGIHVYWFIKFSWCRWQSVSFQKICWNYSSLFDSPIIVLLLFYYSSNNFLKPNDQSLSWTHKCSGVCASMIRRDVITCTCNPLHPNNTNCKNCEHSFHVKKNVCLIFLRQQKIWTKVLLQCTLHPIQQMCCSFGGEKYQHVCSWVWEDLYNHRDNYNMYCYTIWLDYLLYNMHTRRNDHRKIICCSHCRSHAKDTHKDSWTWNAGWPKWASSMLFCVFHSIAVGVSEKHVK